MTKKIRPSAQKAKFCELNILLHIIANRFSWSVRIFVLSLHHEFDVDHTD